MIYMPVGDIVFNHRNVIGAHRSVININGITLSIIKLWDIKDRDNVNISSILEDTYGRKAYEIMCIGGNKIDFGDEYLNQIYDDVLVVNGDHNLVKVITSIKKYLIR